MTDCIELRRCRLFVKSRFSASFHSTLKQMEHADKKQRLSEDDPSGRAIESMLSKVLNRKKRTINPEFQKLLSQTVLSDFQRPHTIYCVKTTDSIFHAFNVR
jgi:hypothetical protein